MKTITQVLIFVILTTTVLSASLREVRQKKHADGKAVYVSKDSTYTRRLELNFTVPFEWRATRGTTNLIVQHSSNYDVTIVEQGDTLVITAVSNVQTSKQRKRRWVKQQMDCTQEDCLNILVPAALIEEFVQDGDQWPVLCKMHRLSDYSSLPSYNTLVFEDKYCKVREPFDWQEWLEFYFGPNSGQNFYGDYDGDGLVNIIEYYGSAAFEDSFLTIICDVYKISLTHTQRDDPSLIELCFAQYNSTDPTQADTDGDLLLDGFEVANFIDPLVLDDPSLDEDGDSLDTLHEQIHKTDPWNPDTDGDTFLDAQEVSAGTDPLNPADYGEPGDQHVFMRLTIGDPSTNKSERCVIHVGEVSHQSPTFADVTSDTYMFGAGTHLITVQHIDSTLAPPDYDYTAGVQKVSGSATIILSDAQGILGDHFESTYFYAAGKVATLVVENNCTSAPDGDPLCTCAQFATCVECKTDDSCVWDIRQQTCHANTVWDSPWDIVSGDDLCPCEECLAWYNTQSNDTAWMTEVNQQFPCPCRATAATYNLVPEDQPAENWVPDIACMVGGLPYCSGFHPGANGCLISVGTTSSGARQQCCYGDDGNLLAAGHLGAGTPDRAGEFWAHQEVDVEPYEWCCSECREGNYCPLYQQVRQGDYIHCNSV